MVANNDEQPFYCPACRNTGHVTRYKDGIVYAQACEIIVNYDEIKRDKTIEPRTHHRLSLRCEEIEESNRREVIKYIWRKAEEMFGKSEEDAQRFYEYLVSEHKVSSLDSLTCSAIHLIGKRMNAKLKDEFDKTKSPGNYIVLKKKDVSPSDFEPVAHIPIHEKVSSLIDSKRLEYEVPQWDDQ
jgi:ribosomal protein L37AE/L43A